MKNFWCSRHSSANDSHQSARVFKLIDLVTNGQPKYLPQFLNSSI